MNKTQREFVHLALKLLGESAEKNIFCEMNHHRIFGILLVSIRVDGYSAQLAEIEQASTSLWLHADLDGEK